LELPAKRIIVGLARKYNAVIEVDVGRKCAVLYDTKRQRLRYMRMPIGLLQVRV